MKDRKKMKIRKVDLGSKKKKNNTQHLQMRKL